MNAEKLYEAFKGLPASAGAGPLSAFQFSESRRDFLAAGAEGEPLFLLEAREGDCISVPRRELRNVSVEYGVSCRIRTRSGETSLPFVMVRCDPAVPELFELFVKGCQAWFEDLQSGASVKEIAARLNSCLDLFRALGDGSTKTVAGLWAELWVIDQASNTRAAIEGWHSVPTEMFDFTAPAGRIEVKATESPDRIHEVSLEQLRDTAASPGVLVSLLLQASVSGPSSLELAARIARKLPSRPDLQQRLWRIVAKSLGSDFSTKVDRRFDEDFAREHVRCFAFKDVPQPGPISSPAVSSVRFRSNLATVAPLPGSVSTTVDRLLG